MFSTTYLRKKYLKCIKVQDRVDFKYSDLQYEIEKELNRRNRAKLYRACCMVLKCPKGWNLFAYAKHFADCVLNGEDYFPENESYEISGYYTKTGNPVVVWFGNPD